MFPITRPILIVVIIFLILYHKTLTDVEYAARRAAKTTIKTAEQIVDTTTDKMPLVVPGLQTKDGDDKTAKWLNELVGKKIGDQTNETTFAKTDLPKQHRIIAPGDFSTQDFVADRLNIHTDKDGTVVKVNHG